MPIRTVEQVKKEALKNCPFNSGFKIGDKVTLTNDHGRKFHGYRIIGFTEPECKGGGWIYIDAPKSGTCAHWFPTHTNNLTLES
jgi:hypothetical protein